MSVDPLILALVFIFSLAVGSFLNVLIYRLPLKMKQELELSCAELRGEAADWSQHSRWFGLYYLIVPSSHCPHCQKPIRPWQNIPLLSFLFQKGRCAHCQQPISWQYPLVELFTAVISVMVIAELGWNEQGWLGLILSWGLIALSVIDIQEQLLPDVLVLPLLWLGLLFNLSPYGFTDIQSAVIGAAGGYLFLWFIFHLFLLLTGKEGMGYGDFKLFALFGAWLGWSYLPQILLLSAVVGALIGSLLLLIRGQDKNTPLPFGPYLAAAGWIALLWGDEINQSYFQLVGL